MCRLIAYLGAPIRPSHLVFGGSHSLYRQSWEPRELLSGSVNADGWGVVWYADGRPSRLADPRPIWHDEGLSATLDGISSGCMIAALRNATPGLPVDRSAIPPLVFERWAFVLNGYVPGFRREHMRALRSDLPDDLYGELTGSSDAETLFLLAVDGLRGGASMAEALTSVAQRVRRRVGDREAQLNMVLTDGERITVARSGTVLVTNSLYVARRPPFAPDGVVLASEAPEPGAAWDAVTGHSWLTVEPDGSTDGDVIFLE